MLHVEAGTDPLVAHSGQRVLKAGPERNRMNHREHTYKAGNRRPERARTVRRLLAAAVVLVLAMGTSIMIGAETPNQNMQEAGLALSPEAFERQVQAEGGSVDFLFQEQRPFESCHASTLVEGPKGDLLCAWFGGSAERQDDVAIWTARFSQGSWSRPARIAKVNNTPHWNPVLFRDPRSVVCLFFKVGPTEKAWQTYWVYSMDGAKWSRPVELVDGDRGGRGPVRCKPIILSNGTWLAGASTEFSDWRPFADWSEDGGLQWQRTADWAFDEAFTALARKGSDTTNPFIESDMIEGHGAIQPTIWESEPGHVHALMRTSVGRIARADSTDYGKTWSTVYLTDLPNNNSGIDVLKLDDGQLLLVYNPVGVSWGPRTPLTLAVSADDGATWRELATLENRPGEYSYPAIVRTSTGVAISYTWKRERIRCWQIPEAVFNAQQPAAQDQQMTENHTTGG